jgi:hypothetical protein
MSVLVYSIPFGTFVAKVNISHQRLLLTDRFLACQMSDRIIIVSFTQDISRDLSVSTLGIAARNGTVVKPGWRSLVRHIKHIFLDSRCGRDSLTGFPETPHLFGVCLPELLLIAEIRPDTLLTIHGLGHSQRWVYSEIPSLSVVANLEVFPRPI